MNIINDNTFNLYDSLLDNDNKYIKVKVQANRNCQVAN